MFNSQSLLAFLLPRFRWGAGAVPVIDELGGDRQDHAVGADPFCLQHLVLVQRRLAALLRQAMLTMAVAKQQMTTAVDEDHVAALQTRRFQRAHAQQTVDHLPTHFRQRGVTNPGEIVVHGLVDGHRRLVGSGQAVEVAEHLRADLAQLEVDLASTAEFTHEEEDADPQEEARMGLHAVGVAPVVNGIQPLVEERKEVQEGAKENRADLQGRPALRFCVWT